MQKTRFKKNITILIHILGWGLFGSVLFLFSPLSWKVDFPNEFWWKQVTMLTLLVTFFYFNLFFLIPKYLLQNRTYLFLAINLASGVGYVLLLLYYDDFFNMPMLMHQAFRPDVPYKPRPKNLTSDFFNLITFYLAVGISTSIAAVQKWQSDEKVRLELEQQQINSELSYLKAQINPHFFFNTLNNIYALTNIDVDKAKTALLKLSRMMRYVLYETEKHHTLLSKELDFIRDFIELMRLRLTAKVVLKLEIPEKIEDAEIAPMLLLPFIENCFKHGISSQTESHIFISVTREKNYLILNTINTIFKSTENTPEANASGIGLINTMRRLDLLYPNKYILVIDKENEKNEYRVTLKLAVT